MNSIKEKINAEVIAFFLVGALVGGLAIGVMDAKRLKPLLSKADGGGVILEECSSEVEALEQYIESLPTNEPRWYIRNVFGPQANALVGQINSCLSENLAASNDYVNRELIRLADVIRELRDEREGQDSLVRTIIHEGQVIYYNYQTHSPQCPIRPPLERPDSNSNPSIKGEPDEKLSNSSINRGPTESQNFDEDDEDNGECEEIWQDYEDSIAELGRERAVLAEIDREIEDANREREEVREYLQSVGLDIEFTRDYVQGIYDSAFSSHNNPYAPNPSAYPSGGGGSRPY